MAVPQLTAADLANPASLNDKLTYLEGLLSGSSLIAGTMMFYGGLTLPTGWLECDGSVVSRTTYASLFAQIGTAFGVGDGSTTFGLPDMRGRTPIGIGTGSGLTNRTLNQQLGEETHILTTAELPAHTHSGGFYTTTNALLTPVGGQFLEGGTIASGGLGSGAVGHQNMQPSLVLKAMIKT